MPKNIDDIHCFGGTPGASLETNIDLLLSSPA